MSEKQIKTYMAIYFVATISHPEQKWDSISMDFITDFPKYLGKDCLYLVVDRLKKFTHLFPITSSCSSAQVADIFFKEILPPLDDEGQLTLLPKKILNTMERRLRSRTIKDYLVQWRDIPSEDATWIEEKILQHSILKLLEDKQSWVGRIVMSPFK